jgi:hypothetical protein
MAEGSILLDTWKDRWSHLVCHSVLGYRLLKTHPEGCGDRLMAEIAALVQHDQTPGPTYQCSAVFRQMTM